MCCAGLVSKSLQLTLTSMEQLHSDTACCQFANMLFPSSIALRKVKLVAELVHKYFDSFENTVIRVRRM